MRRARVSSEAGADTHASVITAQTQAKDPLQIPASLVLLATKQEVGKGDRRPKSAEADADLAGGGS